MTTKPADQRSPDDPATTAGDDAIAAAPTLRQTDPRAPVVQSVGTGGSTPTGPVTVPWHPDGTGPVPTANGPVRRRWRKVAARTLAKAWGDSLFGMSSQAAFWSAMSTAPLLLALLGLVGLRRANWFGPATMTDIRTQTGMFLHTIFNEEVADNLVGNTVDTILNNGQADVVSVGLIISLWAGSSAMSAFVESITIAYCQHEFRHPVRRATLRARACTSAPSPRESWWSRCWPSAPTRCPGCSPPTGAPPPSSIIGYLYYPGLAVGLILLLTTLYKVAPRHKHAWKRGLPGALLAAAIFLVASAGLRLYLSYVYSHGLTYGALATPITFLLFYYFAAMAIIIGAQFNNALLEYYPPRITARQLRRRRLRAASYPGPTQTSDEPT